MIDFPEQVKPSKCKTRSHVTHTHGKHGATKVVTTTPVEPKKG